MKLNPSLKASVPSLVTLVLFMSGCGPSTRVVINPDDGTAVVIANPSQLAASLRDASDAFFEQATVPKIVLQLAESQERKLREDARQYVRCTLVEEGHEPLVDIGLKLKGAVGSFQGLDEKPAFTINVGKYRRSNSFHRLQKFHLNNSVQDELYTNEWLCASICREAGIPAPRVTHARVWLNDRDMGLYVVKEGFDGQFLKRHFRESDGNLYDGGFCQDIDSDLEKDAGKGSSDLSDLRELNAACAEADLENRWQLISKCLDLPAFQSFIAFEMMAGHWDGYVANRNNYRVYFPPDSKRAWFLPHGMDQMFQDPGFQTFGHTPAIVASAVRSNPDWNLQFRKRVGHLLPLFDGDRLASRVKTLHQKIRPELRKWNADSLESFDKQAVQLQERLQERYLNIVQQLTEPDPPVPDESGREEMNEDSETLEIGEEESVLLLDWEPKQETPASLLGQAEAPEGSGEASLNQVLYHVAVGDSNDCIASWRKTVRLLEGHYQLTCEMRVNEVVPRESDDRGIGAGLRISGMNRENALVGSSDWVEVRYDFHVHQEQQDVQLVAELRATKGELIMKNTKLKRLKPTEHETK